MTVSSVVPHGAGAAGWRRRTGAAASPSLLHAALLLGVCSWLAGAAAVPAADAAGGAVPAAAGYPAAPGDAFGRRVPLLGEDAVLRGGRAAVSVPLHLPPDQGRGRPARLTLTYANSLAADPGESALVVSANGAPLAELPLVAAQGAATVELDLPAGIFKEGANRLTFAARQRHRFACSRDDFAELWVRLAGDGSFVELAGAGRAAPTLAGLDHLLASSLYDGEPFTVLTARPASDEVVPDWGSRVAEGYALRRGDRPARIGHAVLRAPGTGGPGEAWRGLAGRNVAVVGTYRELEGILPPDARPRPAGEGTMAVMPLPADPGHVAVILTGPNDAAVTRAVEAFRTAAAPSVAAAAAAAGGDRPPIPGRPRAATPVEGGGWLSLADLGYTTTGQVLSSDEEIEVPLNLPETFYGGDGQKLRLELNFAYGAGLAPTSALVVNVNGAPWNMVRLDRRGGAMVDAKEIELPLGRLRPGPNTIGFRAVLEPEGAETCAAAADRPMFSLFDDSRVHVPAFARLARQPDLALFGATGYPYGSGEVELIVSGADPATLGAAWTLRGKLAQRHGGPLRGLRSGFRRESPDRHLLVVGPRDAVPPALRGAMPAGGAVARGDGTAAAAAVAPLRRGEGGRNPVADRARHDWAERLEAEAPRASGGGPLGGVVGWFIGMARAVPGPLGGVDDAGPRPGAAALITSDRPGAIAAFRSPFVEDRTVTVVAAADARALERAVGDLVEPAVWRRLDGDAMGWGAPTVAPVTLRTAEPYLIEAVETSPGHLLLLARTFLARETTYWLALVFGLLGAVSLTTRALLRRMAAA